MNREITTLLTDLTLAMVQIYALRNDFVREIGTTDVRKELDAACSDMHTAWRCLDAVVGMLEDAVC